MVLLCANFLSLIISIVLTSAELTADGDLIGDSVLEEALLLLTVLIFDSTEFVDPLRAMGVDQRMRLTALAFLEDSFPPSFIVDLPGADSERRSRIGFTSRRRIYLLERKK
jgi:hypothetical protein